MHRPEAESHGPDDVGRGVVATVLVAPVRVPVVLGNVAEGVGRVMVIVAAPLP